MKQNHVLRCIAALLAACIVVLSGFQASKAVQQPENEQAEGSGQPAAQTGNPEDAADGLGALMPEPQITRGVLAALLYDGDDRDAWTWAQQHELFVNTGAENDTVTREQAIYAMLRRCFVQSWPELSCVPVRYADHTSISSNCMAAVYTAQQAGLIPADGGMLHPEQPLTRDVWNAWQEYSASGHTARRSGVTLINHRGYTDNAPENTLGAFCQSAWNGYTAVECDVRFTRDNVPVLLHDPTVDRTSNGTGRVADKSFEQVRRLDFGRWKGKRWKNTRIPTFAEFLSVCRRYHLAPYVELKTALTGAQARNLLRVCKTYGIRPTWIGFRAQALQQISAVDKRARLGLLWDWDVSDNAVQTVKNLQNGKNEVFLDVNWNKLSEHTCNLLLMRGIVFEAYTVDGRLDELRRFGVSRVTTNRVTPRMLAGRAIRREGMRWTNSYSATGASARRSDAAVLDMYAALSVRTASAARRSAR